MNLLLAGPPKVNAEVLCRWRQRYERAAVLERPPRGYDHRQILVEGTSPQGLTCHCTDKDGHIYSPSLHICRVVLLLLRQLRDERNFLRIQPKKLSQYGLIRTSELSRNPSFFKMLLTISRPLKKNIQPGGEAASPPACAIGAFIYLHGQNEF